MHMLGLRGMPRRQYTYPKGMGWDLENMIMTIGTVVLVAAFLVFLYNLIRSYRGGEVAGNDPWDARTLEWTITSPPPVHNFDEIPQVHALDDFWHRKYAEDDGGRLVPVAAGGSDEAHEDHAAHAEHAGNGGHGIHMPDPSWFPALAALGLPCIGYGLVFHRIGLIAIGGILALAGLFGWAFEPSAEA
jgi:cytochrome c oxidase subunit 1